MPVARERASADAGARSRNARSTGPSTEGGAESKTHNAHIPIHGRDPPIRAGLLQFRGDELLDGEDDAVGAAEADGGAAVFDGLDRVLDLYGTMMRQLVL